MRLPLRSCPILLITRLLQTELDSTQFYYHYELYSAWSTYHYQLINQLINYSSEEEKRLGGTLLYKR